MPAEDPPTTDAEGLAAKIRAFTPQLTAGERRLLSRALTAAALLGVPIATGDLTVHNGRNAPTGAVAAAPGSAAPGADTAADPDTRWGDIRAQFAADYTPGETWDPPVVESIKPPGEEF